MLKVIKVIKYTAAPTKKNMIQNDSDICIAWLIGHPLYTSINNRPNKPLQEAYPSKKCSIHSSTKAVSKALLLHDPNEVGQSF